MKYLLDTCVLSEFIKPRPSSKLVHWLDGMDSQALAISVLSIGELQQGISRLPAGKRQNSLQQWLSQELLPRFADRVFPLELNDAMLWGQLAGEAIARGKTLPAMDTLLAATAIERGMILVTRNVKDFVRMPLRIFNPWE